MFNNLDKIKTSLGLDKLLIRSLALLMKPRHYPYFVENVPSRIIVKFMVDFILKEKTCTNEDVSTCYIPSFHGEYNPVECFPPRGNCGSVVSEFTTFVIIQNMN